MIRFSIHCHFLSAFLCRLPSILPFFQLLCKKRIDAQLLSITAIVRQWVFKYLFRKDRLVASAFLGVQLQRPDSRVISHSSYAAENTPLRRSVLCPSELHRRFCISWCPASAIRPSGS